MRFTRLFISTLILVGGIILLSINPGVQGAPDLEYFKTSAVGQAIGDAIQEEIGKRADDILFQVYDWEISRITLASDQSRAIAWLDPLDRVTGMTIATEPLMVIAELTQPGLDTDSSSWQVVFNGDFKWDSSTSHLADMLPVEIQNSFASAVEAPDAPLAILGGYKLPWAAGLTKFLEWSTEHSSCAGSYCYYALDFADGSMFPLLAAKGGTVFFARDSCINGATDCTNILTLRDVSTSPISYQIYYHLANNSIPAALHSVGTPVSQGQFIGVADDTGFSTDHHLHFMVTTNINSEGTWGPSVDITFRDVSINWDAATQGGRPRTQAGAQISGGEWQTNYTSQNFGTNPPTGGLTLPGDRITLTTAGLATAGWGSDNMAVTRMQLIAYFGEAWHEVGAPQTANPFNYTMDVCSAGIPIGPFDLALRVWDYEGNQSPNPLGIRHLVNSASCPEQSPPICLPDPDQVALFSDINFSGSCRILGIGNHRSDEFAPVLDNSVSSVLLGNNIKLRMYDGASWSNRIEVITQSDPNLVDNPIGKDRISSISVQSRIFESGYQPVVELGDMEDPHGPSSAAPTSIDTIILYWQTRDSTKFQTRVFSGFLSSGTECGVQTPILTRMPLWSNALSWMIGTLPAGNYSWCLQGRISDKNNTPYLSPWVVKTFSIGQGSFSTTTVQTLPYNNNIEAGENGWTKSGLWRLVPDSWNGSNHLWACNNSDGDYGDSTYGGGDLTSPPIQIPNEGATLRFRYRYETESDQVHWDQRWVQIASDNGIFQNLVLLSDDEMNTWLTSPAIDLSAYAGSTVRIRFHFSIVDKYYNGELEGWLVDDITITTPLNQGCEESSNNTLSDADMISIGDEVGGFICPAGDFDYFKFSASAGDKLTATVRANQLTPPSLLDPFLTLMDQDKYGNSPLFESDDIQVGVMTDSQIHFIVRENGNYYLKVRAGDHPTSGGSSYKYVLSLSEQSIATDIVAPSLTMLYPSIADGVPSGNTVFSALSDDWGSGVNRLDFWWHPPDWINGQWMLLASDTYGGDGWQAPFDGSGYYEGQTGALVVIAYDWEGNTNLVVNWNVAIDNSPPVTTLIPLPATTDGTGIRLSWNAFDLHSRLGSYDIQYQMDGGSWLPLQVSIPAKQLSTWFIGLPGHVYGFRIRARDIAGNQGTYPSTAEVATRIAASCSVDIYDQGTGDGQATFATELQLNVFQDHNFCGSGDVDWVEFAAEMGQPYLIWILPGSNSPAGSSIELYQTNETQWLMHAEAPNLISSVSVRWVAPTDGIYLIRVMPSTAGITGNNTGYRIRVGSGWWFNLPVVFSN